jgi:hypothetical protein
MACDIPGFPRPVIIRRRVYWKTVDIDALEEAFFRYEGRGAFERRRETVRKVDALRRAKASLPQRRSGKSRQTPEPTDA